MSKNIRTFYVAHFYNTAERQMLPCLQGMMLDVAIEFEKAIRTPKSTRTIKESSYQVIWDNPKEVEQYIGIVQASAQRLMILNRKLQRYHAETCDLQIKSENMKAWKLHWNFQLYKALHHQFQVGLIKLADDLPDIKLELLYRQQQLVLKPPAEEIRSKYYHELRKFLGIPQNFKGVYDVLPADEDNIFLTIIERSSDHFCKLYADAEELFEQLADLEETFMEWVQIGQINLDQLIEEKFNAVLDWEYNFKLIKSKGRDVEKLPNEVKIGCLIVNTQPVKMSIEELLQRIYDTLVFTLRNSVQTNVQMINQFLTDAIKTLAIRPQTMEEIAVANQMHQTFVKKRKDLTLLLADVESRAKVLRTVAVGYLESLNSTQQLLEKFDVVLESHQMNIKEQVLPEMS
ncbi:unnamed protein product [Soboliphyme baturini]|uniref:DHC_N1 domain-containing protein n=1 Tax=Soboliphyme baturini TaxID=241478 RepID=A0A183IB07_9BILA|nr:unnamed protein product [Soboliphyme baturini]